MKKSLRFLKIASLSLLLVCITLFNAGIISLVFTYHRMQQEFLVDLERSRTLEWVKYEDVPKLLVEATILVEDPHFRECSNWSIWNQYYQVFFKGDKELNRCSIGFYVARMATQRLHGGTLMWQVRSLASTQALFANYSHEQILEEFFNRVYVGVAGGKVSFGYPAGARAFFGKELKDLNRDQIAILVGVVQSPQRYSPYKNEEASWRRAEFVLQKMQEAGLIEKKIRGAAPTK